MEFDKVLSNRIESTIAVLKSKAKEYAPGVDRYHNFNKAGRMHNIEPEEALKHFLTKHLVSIFDFVEDLPAIRNDTNLAMVQEKIGDAINYLILLEGMIIDRFEKQNLDEGK